MPRENKQSRKIAISLYTGAGGLDYGFEAAGFCTAVALELDHDSCETVRRNRTWPVIEKSIFDVSTDEILEAGALKRGEADILIGGPPCQPFSKSGYWASGDARRLQDPRSRTLDAYLRVLEEALPRAFLLENVHGIAYSDKSEGLRLLCDRIEDINRRTGSNYKPVMGVLNAAWYGVPQLRERFFMIASRDGEPFEFPTRTHRSSEGDQQDLGFLPVYRTAWDALGDLKDSRDEDLSMKGKWADLLPSIPEGWNYIWHTDHGGGIELFGWRRRYWTFLLKLSKRLPSWTIQAQPGPAVGPFHWENRRLSERELCRLQTFPDDVRIFGSRISIQRQVGNAVPSLLAKVLARAIRDQLLHDPIDDLLQRLPPDRSPAPPPEPVRPVAEKYLKLVASHEPHPGTGRGPRALRKRESQQVEVG